MRTSITLATAGQAVPARAGAPTLGAPNPSSNFASIAAAERAAAFFVSSEMDTFMGRKIENILASPTPLCVPRDRDDETVVPRASPCIGCN